MPISQENIFPGRSYRTVANELREVSAVEKDEVVYHSVFPGSAGLMVRTPDKPGARPLRRRGPERGRAALA